MNDSHESSKKRKGDDGSNPHVQKKKRAIKVSHSEHERLKAQVKQLKCELEMCKENWMRECLNQQVVLLRTWWKSGRSFPVHQRTMTKTTTGEQNRK